MGKVMLSGVSKGAYAPLPIKANFADNDWSTIITACQLNKIPSTWNIGDQKSMLINGTNYPVNIIGFNHDDYADGSGKAPITFQLHNGYATTYAINSSNDNTTSWGNCAMRTSRMSSILSLMPSEVQAGIRKVNKLTASSGTDTTIKTTEDKLFLLSEVEVFGSNNYSNSGEGKQYDYYSAGNRKNKSLIGSSNNSAWWERSPYKGGTVSFCWVDTSGKAGGRNASTSNAVVPAFCF